MQLPQIRSRQRQMWAS